MASHCPGWRVVSTWATPYTMIFQWILMPRSNSKVHLQQRGGTQGCHQAGGRGQEDSHCHQPLLPLWPDQAWPCGGWNSCSEGCSPCKRSAWEVNMETRAAGSSFGEEEGAGERRRRREESCSSHHFFVHNLILEFHDNMLRPFPTVV